MTNLVTPTTESREFENMFITREQELEREKAIDAWKIADFLVDFELTPIN